MFVLRLNIGLCYEFIYLKSENLQSCKFIHVRRTCGKPLVISAESANLYLTEKLGIYPHGKDAVVTSVSDWVISHIPQGDKYK